MTAGGPCWGRQAGRPLVLGHRGDRSSALENTLPAFAAARAAGADGVEFDVRLCGSGEVIVFHDADLRRLADRPERIDRLPLSALRGVELTGGFGVPTLDEVIEAVGSDLLLNIELKAEEIVDHAPLVAGVVDAVRRHRLGSRALVSSFNPIALLRVRAAAPALPTGLLFHAEQAAPLREAWAAPAVRPLAVHPDHRLVTPRRVGQWRRRGYAINVWTVDDPNELDRLVGLGVDGVIADAPGAARARIAVTARSLGA